MDGLPWVAHQEAHCAGIWLSGRDSGRSERFRGAGSLCDHIGAWVHAYTNDKAAVLHNRITTPGGTGSKCESALLPGAETRQGHDKNNRSPREASQVARASDFHRSCPYLVVRPSGGKRFEVCKREGNFPSGIDIIGEARVEYYIRRQQLMRQDRVAKRTRPSSHRASRFAPYLRCAFFKSSCSDADRMRSISPLRRPSLAASSRHVDTALPTCAAMAFALSFFSSK